jgi:hypothetical protein
MTYIHTDAEDAIIAKGFREGLSDQQISRVLTAAGFKRGREATARRRSALGFTRDRRFTPRKLPVEPVVTEHVSPDYSDVNDKFCAALRKHHPDKETPVYRSQASSSVPVRFRGDHVFSSTGDMVP